MATVTYPLKNVLTVGVLHLIYGGILFFLLLVVAGMVCPNWETAEPAPMPFATDDSTDFTAPAPEAMEAAGIRVGIEALSRRLFLTRDAAAVQPGLKTKRALYAVTEFLIYAALATVAGAVAVGLLIIIPILPMRILLRRFADSDGQITVETTAGRVAQVMGSYANRSLAPLILFGVLALFLQPEFFRDFIVGFVGLFTSKWSWPASVDRYLTTYIQMLNMVPVPASFPSNLLWVAVFIITYSIIGLYSVAGIFYRDYHVGIATEAQIKAGVLRASL